MLFLTKNNKLPSSELLFEIQPIYKDREEEKKKLHIPRSESCPHFFLGDGDDNETKMILDRKERKRAFSECIKTKQMKVHIQDSFTLTRPQSDSDLSFIDKEKTFAPQSQQKVEPGELLAKISAALNDYRNGYSSQTGFSGLTDSQILADELNCSNLSIATSAGRYICPPVNSRNRRALSEVCIPIEKSIKVNLKQSYPLFIILKPFCSF